MTPFQVLRLRQGLSGPAPMAVRDAIMAISPTVYWRLGEPSGVAVVNDETGNFSGAYTEPSDRGPAIYLGGLTSMRSRSATASHAYLSANLPASSEITTCCIVQLVDAADAIPIGLMGDNGVPRQFQFRQDAGILQFVRINNFVGPTEVASFDVGIAAGSTYALALTVNSSGTCRLYINGNQAGVATITPMSFGGNNTQLAVGYSSGMARYANAYFSECAFALNAASPAAIKAIAVAAGF